MCSIVNKNFKSMGKKRKNIRQGEKPVEHLLLEHTINPSFVIVGSKRSNNQVE